MTHTLISFGQPTQDQVETAMQYCQQHGDTIKEAVRDGNDQAVELWGAYVGAKHVARLGRSGGCDEWLVRCYNKYMGQG